MVAPHFAYGADAGSKLAAALEGKGRWRFEGARYVEHGVFAHGETARSGLLEGFAVDAAAAFDAPKPPGR